MAENKLRPYILGTLPRPANATDQVTWEEKDIEAQAFIMRGLELEQLKYLSIVIWRPKCGRNCRRSMPRRATNLFRFYWNSSLIAKWTKISR